MHPTSFERWLYLQLHRCRLMGTEDRTFLERTVRPGMRILDVGSNLGLYSVLAARLAGESGRTICFEPDALLYSALCQNLVANGLERVETHAVGLGAAPAKLEFHRSIINSGDNHLGEQASELLPPGESRHVAHGSLLRGEVTLTVICIIHMMRM